MDGAIEDAPRADVGSEDSATEDATDGSVVTPDTQALHLTMRDGTHIAIDVWLDPAREAGATFPVLLRGTRYWRAMEERMPIPGGQGIVHEAATAHTHGYALVAIDARGSGASHGVRRHPWSEEEQQDYREVIDWIIAQPWSDGTVVSYGVSYAGNVADFVGLLDHPAVKAVSPQFSDVNPYTDLAAPGGVRNERYIFGWSRYNQGLDNNDLCAALGLDPMGAECTQYRTFVGGVKPVDGDDAHTLLDAAIAERTANLDVAAAFREIDYSDNALGGVTVPELGTERRFDDLARIGTPVYAIASWLDAGTATGALRRFLNSDSPQTVYIGAWSHEGEFADPFLSPEDATDTDERTQSEGMYAYFNAAREGTVPARRLHYYTMNENIWRESDRWPPEGVSEETWFLGDGTLAREAPLDESSRTYPVDFSHATGSENRWMQDTLDYGDRRDAPVHAYVSAPLREAMRVTGSPQVAVRLSSTHTDGALFVYLEDVAPDGTVTYITEGVLRLANRAEQAVSPFTPVMTPARSLASVDAAPLNADESVSVRVPLMPTSVRLETGHQIRISFAGHDEGFQRIPAEGEPTLRFFTGGSAPSQLILPVAAD